MRIYFTLYIFLVLLQHSNPTLAQGVSNNTNQRHYLNFSILESEFCVGKYITSEKDSSGFIKYEWKKTPCKKSVHNRMLTLRADFYLNKNENINELYLAATPIEYACQIYLNGELVARRGNIKNGYTNRLGSSEIIFLPASHLKKDSINKIAIQLYPKNGEQEPLTHIFISSYKDASTYVFRRNLYGPFVYKAISICSFIIFIYYFLLFFFQRAYHKRHYLYFSFVNLFFVLMSLNSLIDHNFANTFLLEKIVRASTPLVAFWLLQFFIFYTDIFKKKSWAIHSSVVIYFTASLYTLIQPTTIDVIKAFNTFPAISIFIGMLFMFVASAMNLKKQKNIKSIVLLFIFLVSLIAAGYDFYNFSILKIVPYAWFVPYAIFISNISLFILLAIEQAQIQRDLIIKADDLKFVNENLDKLVEERTNQLNKTILELNSEIEIRQKIQNELKDANATKDKFFSIIAHDLKNPFNGIIGLSNLLLNNLKNYTENDIRLQLMMINSSSKNSYLLLENLLEWARAQTNEIKFCPENQNLIDLSIMSITSIQGQASNKSITIINEINNTHCIFGDKNILMTVFRNLLSNAIKYTNYDGTIILQSFSKNNMIELWVTDSGIGMPQSTIDKLFRIDIKYSEPGTQDEKGTGLGLILCKEFIAKHGGTISVESTVGKGSTFKITLPVCKYI